MPTMTKDRYAARCLFQQDLDSAFPHGAICAILPMRDGKVRPGGWMDATGRLFCRDARRSEDSDQWEFEILIDTRTRVDAEGEEIGVWVTGLSAHPSVEGLWEAPAGWGDERRLLRLNADPSAKNRPTAAMRTAVTEVHLDALFPEGFDA